MKNKQFVIIFLLGFSSGLPLALLTSTLQAWFADSGISILTIGMLSLLGLPYIYKTLWGPLLDRYSLLPLGRRRSWILIMQFSLLLGFNAMAWFTPSQSAEFLAILALMLACFSATQDIAIDAHRIEYLTTHEHALGASLAVCGYRLALLIGGGFALIIANHLGWATTYRFMGMLMLVGVAATCLSKEPSTDVAITHGNILSAFVTPILELSTRRGIIPLILFILLYKLGEAFTATTSGIVMPFLIQGLDLSLDTIGYINKIVGAISVVFGGLAAGILLLRCSLYRALLGFGLLQAVSNLLFVALAMVGKNLPLFVVAVVCDNLATGMGSTALVALFMRLTHQQFTATQFSIFATLASLPRVASGPIGALLQMWFGWVGLYQISVVLALSFIPFLYMIKEQIILDVKIPPSNKVLGREENPIIIIP